MISEQRRRLKPISIVAGLIVLIVVCLAWLTYQSRKSHELIDRFMDYDAVVIQLIGEIIQLDQTLTGTTRTAAETGDLTYVVRYGESSERLDDAINEVIRLSPPEIGEGFESMTKSANDALVAMETRAMELIEAGNSPEARAILYSQEYEQGKTEYATGIVFLRDYMDDVKRKAVRDKERNATVTSIMTCVLLASIAGLIFVFIYQIRMHKALEHEKRQSETLLHNILPQPVANRLKGGEQQIADSFQSVTVLFADIVGFTRLSEALGPHAIVGRLNEVFTIMDRLSEKHGLEKIKTIGDAYMVVGGLPVNREAHTEAVANMALETREAIEELNAKNDYELDLRFGMHRGEVVAGVIGLRKFAYDLWGDTVNTASRMESTGVPGRIQCTGEVHDHLKDSYEFEARGMIQVKGKMEMQSFFLLRKRR